MSAVPAGSGGLPTRSEIEEWDTSDLANAATNWRSAATEAENAFDEHRQNISSPGGTTWEGNAKDAALDRVTADCAVVGRQGGALREAAGLAENGSHDIKSAQDKAVEAINAAEDDGFSVGEDLAVTDTKKVDVFSMRARQTSANEHAEDIRWTAMQLMQADQLVGDRLQAKATELDGIRFDSVDEGRDSSSGHVYFVDSEVKYDDSEGGGGGKPAQAPGRIGPFAVPKSVEAVTKTSEAKPEGTSSGPAERRTPKSLQEMLLPEGMAEPTKPPPLTPAQVEDMRTMARKLLQQQSVPPDQIEQRANTMVADAQRLREALAENPRSAGPAGPAPGRPSYSDGFRDAWQEMEDSVHSLTGQNGFESFKGAWMDMGAGTLDTLSDPYGSAARRVEAEIEAFRNNPEYWVGGKSFEAGVTAATLPFGGELAAARGALGDVVHSGVPHEVVHTPTHVDTPSPSDHHVTDPGGHGAPGSSPLPFDVDSPISTARPDFTLVSPLDHMSPELLRLSEQHITGSGETVLGPFAPAGGGQSYIDVARDAGASYFDIGEAWNSATPTQQLAANQHVLDLAIANRDTIRLSVPYYEIRPDTFTGAELRYIQERGYQRVDDTTFVPQN